MAYTSVLVSLLSVLIIVVSGCEEQSSNPADPQASEGKSRPSSLSRFLGAASTADCAHGGIEVEYGIDTDGDGVLDDGEVNGSHVLCHGAPGEDGTAAEPTSDGARSSGAAYVHRVRW